MGYRLRSVFSLVALTFIGCVETEKPPYAAGDVVFDPVLLGEWIDQGGHERGNLPPSRGPGKATHRIDRLAGGGHRSTGLAGEKEVNDFTVFKLGDRYFIATKGDEGRTAVERVTVSGSLLKARSLNIGELLGEPDVPKHRHAQFAIVLTGSTDEIRLFLAKHADDPGVWDRKFRVLQCVNGLKVAPAGLTGRKQRTLDYWAGLRLIMQDPVTVNRPPRSDLAAPWSAAAIEIKFLATDGVDQDAIACGALATEVCNAMHEYAGMRRQPSDPLAALIRETTGGTALDPAALPSGREKVLEQVRDTLAKLEATRKKLEDRYKCEFPSVR